MHTVLRPPHMPPLYVGTSGADLLGCSLLACTPSSRDVNMIAQIQESSNIFFNIMMLRKPNKINMNLCFLGCAGLGR